MTGKNQGVAAARQQTREIVGIKIRFTLNSKNGLRRVIVGLDKRNEGSNAHWIIDFELYEREKRAADFGDPLVQLQVELDTTLHRKAEIAAQNGLTPGQAAHALGPAADDAKAARAGEIDPEEANQTIQATLKKR